MRMATKARKREGLQTRLAEFEATLAAIRRGEVDALVVETPKGPRAFTLQSPEEPYRILFERMSEGVATIDPEGLVLHCNPRLAEMAGSTPARLVGSSILAALAEEDRERFPALLRQALSQNVRTYVRVVRGEGDPLTMQVSLSHVPLESTGEAAVCLIATDVTGQQKAEHELRRLNRAYKALSRCTGAVARATEEKQLLQEVCDLAVQVGGYRLVWVGYAQDDPGKTVRPMAMAGEASAYVTTARITWDDGEFGQGPTGTAIRTGASCFVVDIAREPLYAPWRESALRYGLGSVMTAPLKDGERSFGTLNVYAAERDAFDQEERELVEELAANLGYGILTLRTRDEVRKASLYARSLIEASLDPLVTISPQGKITDVNEATVRVTGVARDHLIGTEFSDYFTEPEKAQAGYRQVFADGFVTDYPLTIRHRDGRLTDVLYNATVYNDESGSALGLFAAARDVTARKRAEEEILRLNVELEQRVAQRTAQLEAANKDLEAFTYSVAHDLRAPLRHVDGFARMLAEDYAAKLDEPGRHFVDQIVHGTTQMGQLIDDLLNLSRVGRHELQPQIVGLRSLAAEVIEQCKSTAGDRHITWQVGELPFVECDAALMKQVFVNLIGNAVKFTGPRAEAVIEIGRREVNGETAIFVRDNGVGFDMKYAGKLFGVFQRLHRQEDFEGTGVGLVTVQRIIQKHGGRVWAEARLDRGAIFYFTLPQTAANRPESEAVTAALA